VHPIFAVICSFKEETSREDGRIPAAADRSVATSPDTALKVCGERPETCPATVQWHSRVDLLFFFFLKRR
jgi:hypothetical protein